ncbi:lysine transporter LysE [Aureimonas endophytica]|uniref:Lysine transporter LysE n=1 Tax=Aureimonas endophytica TaxID=2027858 RepID=A0A917E823_9HYPH|nr:LysE family translocator [Aureimonas endophytica]GGE09851.1 lysine transporter LysE [Aureimonas endophytica]
MTLANVLAYCLALGIAAAIPGPGVVALVARALGSGFRHGLAFAAGLVLGDLTYLTAACFGLAMIAAAMGEVFVVIRYGAALYLAYLAWQLWRAGGRAAAIRSLASESALASVSAGYLVTLSNPKTIFFYLALLPTLLDLHAIDLGSFAALAVATILVLFAVMIAYAALAARARSALDRSRLLARLNRSAAAIMAGTAVWTVLRRA